MTNHPIASGRFVAVAATLVSAPRLMLSFLIGDGVAVPEPVRITLLCTSSAATAVAVTGGAAYLARAIAVAATGRRFLAAAWLAAVLASSALMAPLIVAGLASSPLAGTLDSSASRWTWAVCAVLAVDLVAAGAMRADAAGRRDDDKLAQEHQRAVAELIDQRDHARADARRAEALLTTIDATAQGPRGARPPRPTRGPAEAQPAAGLPAAAQMAAGPVGSAREQRCACGKTFPSQQALAGHRRWCRVAAAQAGRWQPSAPPATVADVGS